MNLDELKQSIEEKTGIPVSLLKGENEEEIIVTAKAMLAYKREQDAKRPGSTADQFAKWTNALYGIEEPDTAGAALAEIEEAVRVSAGGYPLITDGGEVSNLPDSRSTRDQFAEWLAPKVAFNPYNDRGWKHSEG